MSLIDTLAHKQASSSHFQVDKASLFVPIIVNAQGFLYTPTGKPVFQKGDNFKLLSLGFVLPLGFEIYNSTESSNGNEFQLPCVNLFYDNVLGGISPIVPEGIFIPYANYELNIGNFFGASLSDDWRMKIVFRNTINVSMINIPADIEDETIFYVPIWAKFEHNLFIIPYAPPP